MNESEEKPACLISVPEYIRHLSKELEIEGIEGLEGNEMEIIALIRNCPFLYDKSYPDFKDTFKKNETWESIAEVFKVPVQDLQERWRRMRESYAKYTHYNKKRSSDYSRINNVPYYEEMSFLLPFIVRRNARSNGSTTIVHVKEESNTSASEQEITSTEYELNYEVLLNAVRQHPVLYYRRHKDAKNHLIKMKTWKKVAQEMGIPVSDCVSKWKLLRERYARERKFRKENPGLKKWYLFDKLSFLNDHVASRKRFSNTQIQNQSSQVFDLSLLQSSNVYNNSSSPTFDFNEHQYCKKMENDVNYITIEELGSMDGLTNRREEKTKNVKELMKDEDELFALAIAAELRQIPSGKKKRKLKADIYKLLYEYSDQ